MIRDSTRSPPLEAFDPAAAKVLQVLKSGNFEGTALRLPCFHGGRCRDLRCRHLFAETKGKHRAAETLLRLRFGGNWRVKRLEERKYDDQRRAAAKGTNTVEQEPVDPAYWSEVIGSSWRLATWRRWWH